MKSKVLLITPPFTQLNTPYPATAYIKGFLNTKGIACFQCDLGIEVILEAFSKEGLRQMFGQIDFASEILSENARRILSMADVYVQTIDSVIAFLQGKANTLAHRIVTRQFLPEAARFAQLDDLQWAFGALGTQDKAKHLVTMYLEDISDLIIECIDPHFGFSRYAERLARSANSFDELYDALQQPFTFFDEILIRVLKNRVEEVQPELIGLSVPFPGNLYSALRCGQWLKQNFPHAKIVLGGGFANTELRSLSDPRVFSYIDFVTLDDGEAPLEQLIAHIDGTVALQDLKRTFTLIGGNVVYVNNASCADYKQSQVGTPDYSNLLLDKYISVLEVANPMHRLWSDGRWNKLTMAHGCYWGKCTFCDITLDYIKNYEPIAAALLADRMEDMVAQTGETGFHFVDEAAPPSLIKALSLEILKRKMVVSWWANIRFEKSFTYDLCQLMKAAGCIAVSGGLEVASDRLLALIQKGITVAQVATVNRHFADAGIMVHAYLMYGFPTQSVQETVDSLEMVRQMFKTGVLQSAYWHQFAMTAHSPVGQNPEAYQVQKVTDMIGSFANNDLQHIDPTGAPHEDFAFGLKKSLFNYMHNIGINEPLHKWFDFKIPKTTIDPNYIENILQEAVYIPNKDTARIIWLGAMPSVTYYTKSKKGNQWEMATLVFQHLRGDAKLNIGKDEANWLLQYLPLLAPSAEKAYTFGELRKSFEENSYEDFELFWDNKLLPVLGKIGLLKV